MGRVAPGRVYRRVLPPLPRRRPGFLDEDIHAAAFFVGEAARAVKDSCAGRCQFFAPADSCVEVATLAFLGLEPRVWARVKRRGRAGKWEVAWCGGCAAEVRVSGKFRGEVELKLMLSVKNGGF